MDFTSTHYNRGTDAARIELRARAGITPGACADILLIISLKNSIPHKYPKAMGAGTKEGVDLQLSLNGTAEFTFLEWEETLVAINFAKAELKEDYWAAQQEDSDA